MIIETGNSPQPAESSKSKNKNSAQKKSSPKKPPQESTKGKGRPSKYKPEYCKKIIDFFSIEPYEEVTVKFTNYKDGSTKEEYGLRGNDLPFISGFARSIGVNQDTLHEWAHKHPDFSEALKEAKELQKEMLITNGLNRCYNPAFAIFAAKNMIGWRDVQEHEHGGEVKLSLTELISKVRNNENRLVPANN